MSGDTGAKIWEAVIEPEVLAFSFSRPDCQRVLECWRDGRFRIVVTRDMLRRYINLLSCLGASEPILKKWILWFTHPEKSRFIESEIEGIVISLHPPENAGGAQDTLQYMSPQQFVDQLESSADLSNTDSN